MGRDNSLSPLFQAMKELQDQKQKLLERELHDRCTGTAPDKRFHVVFNNDKAPVVDVDMRSCCQWHAHEFIYYAIWNDVLSVLPNVKIASILVKEIV